QEADAEQAVVGARTLTEALETRLRTVMHVDGRTPLTIGEAIEDDVPCPDPCPRRDESRDLERLTAEAEAARPEMRGLDAGIAALASQARAAAGSVAPALGVFAEVTDASPNP